MDWRLLFEYQRKVDINFLLLGNIRENVCKSKQDILSFLFISVKILCLFFYYSVFYCDIFHKGG